MFQSIKPTQSPQKTQYPSPYLESPTESVFFYPTTSSSSDLGTDEEDDSSDWEDSAEETGNSGIDDKTFFQRIHSKPILTTCQSSTTTMLRPNDTATVLNAAALRSTPAI